MPFPVLVLLIVFLLVIVRQIGKFRVEIYQAMLLGSIIVLISGDITPHNALMAINPDVMLFLAGMFILGRALEESGYLSHLTYEAFKRAKTIDGLILSIIFIIGVFSALLMNDTLAIIGTPAVLNIARKHRINPKMLLFTLAFAITIGSVMSPIGNPQNLLISIQWNIKNPFITFLKFLFIPTLLNLFVAYIIIKLFFKEDFNNNSINYNSEQIRYLELMKISRFSLIILCVLVFFKIVFTLFEAGFDFKITSIAVISALPIILFSKRRFEVLKNIDWATLIFFASMFVLMQCVWDSGFFQGLIKEANINLVSISVIFCVSILLSQFISNVPLVALYIPILQHSGAGIKEILALAAGSTIAGNLSILGAASNVIIIQNYEQRASSTITFREFLILGIPLTFFNAILYWFYLSFVM